MFYALLAMKNRKAPQRQHTFGGVQLVNTRKFCQLFNAIYDSVNIPAGLPNTSAAVQKKFNAKACKKYQLISLMSYMLRAFLKIIHKKIYSNKVNIKKNQMISR